MAVRCENLAVCLLQLDKWMEEHEAANKAKAAAKAASEADGWTVVKRQKVNRPHFPCSSKTRLTLQAAAPETHEHSVGIIDLCKLGQMKRNCVLPLAP